MRKLTVQCPCGQLMRVPRTAIGKRGLCPSCGQGILITKDGTAASSSKRRRNGDSLSRRKASWWRGRAEPSEEAKQRFGEAIDLYAAARHGEALAIFDQLAKDYPNNPDVLRGQRQCVKAMRRAALPGATRAQASESRLLPGPVGELDTAAVRRVILDKMLNATSETAQLQAAELAGRMLGMFDDEKGAAKAEQDAAQTEQSEGGDDPQTQEDTSSSNGETTPIDEQDDMTLADDVDEAATDNVEEAITVSAPEDTETDTEDDEDPLDDALREVEQGNPFSEEESKLD